MYSIYRSKIVRFFVRTYEVMAALNEVKNEAIDRINQYLRDRNKGISPDKIIARIPILSQ